MKSLTPSSIAPPFGEYAHGIIAPLGARILVTSGQLGLSKEGDVPSDVAAQAEICFANITAILAETRAGPEHVIRLNAYVTDRAFFGDYMAVRDRWLAHVTVKPASTLMIVSGFTRPEFLVEVEATAAVGV